MNQQNKESLENICIPLALAFDGVVSWKWDSRFETILAEFAADNKGRIRSTLEQFLAHTWDSSTVANAPVIVQTVADRLGGLMSGQLFFTSDPDREPFMFGAWWPWGDGQTISIRLAPAAEKSSGSEKAAQLRRFRDWFGL